MIGIQRRRTAAIALVALLLVGACTSTPPAHSPSPDAPAPSPTATDPAPTAGPTTPPAHGPDDAIELAGLRHDSRDLLYRTPAGAVPAGTPVRLRLRTFHEDVTSARLRLYSVNSEEVQLVAMERIVDGVECYQPELADERCDFWEAALHNEEPDIFWYRFIVADGSATAYYADDTPALDGGVGAATTEQIDHGYALTVHERDFVAPDWAHTAVVYHIFPDRFRNGDPTNDPQSGEIRYDDPVLALPWGTMPEGHCRFYADRQTACPWRYDDDPPEWSPDIEGPRNRDYMGGDLRGVIEQLDYLAALGITAIYLNPIFSSASNHGYDTRDYTQIEPYFGTQADFDELVAAARERGIALILDGVFNHMSSDSPFFDRYGHYETLGACESVESPWRSWFYFRLGVDGGPCVAPGGPNRMIYDSWFGYDSIPVINKTRSDVVDYFLTADDSIARRWLRAGAGGWRMDVSADPSFPDGYWETFREVVKAEDPDALTISETWQKDTILLRNLRGDRFDTTMNYRLRDVVLGLLTPTGFDAKGFPDSGGRLPPSRFAERLLSMQEDYAPAAYFSLMNLLDSHDTERALWALTPGPATRAGRELNDDNVAEGKQRMRLASLIQYGVPGMPVVYYGGEVGLSGSDDPDNRRTYPWADLGGEPDEALLAHYQQLAELRRENPALTAGTLHVLLADDAEETVGIGRRTDEQAAIIVINRSDEPRTLSIPTFGFVPAGTEFAVEYHTGGEMPAIELREGGPRLELGPLSGVLLTTGLVDLTPPNPPVGLRVDDVGDGYVEITWQPSGDGRYNVYRSPLSGGGWLRLNREPISSTSYYDSGDATGVRPPRFEPGSLDNARPYHYVVTALDATGNESGYSNEATGMPLLSIADAVLAGPHSLTHTISAIAPTAPVCARVWVEGAREDSGPTPTLAGELGYGPPSTPPTDGRWTWVEATFAGDADGADEFCASLLPDSTGTFDYGYRFTTSRGLNWLYTTQPGSLMVEASGDVTPPATPTGLEVGSASAAGVVLTWNEVIGDPTFHGYEVARAGDPTGPFRTLALVPEAGHVDLDVAEGVTYHYVVRAVDTSWNRSPDSEVIEATPGPRLVSIVFTVTTPQPTGPATGRTVYIAGTLDRLDSSLPQWDPAGVAMTQVDDTHWTIAFEAPEGTEVEYKYVLGAWDYVEKGASCEEISNRRVTLTFGDDGTHEIDDAVLNWRNIGGCPS